MGYHNESTQMSKLILRFTGNGTTPAKDLKRVRSLSGCRGLEESGRMVLLEGNTLSENELTSLFPDWVATPLKSEIKVPDPRPKPKRPPN